MKRTFLSFVIIAFVSCLIVFACSKSDSEQSDSVPEIISAYSSGSPQYASLVQLQNSNRISSVQSFISSFGTISMSNATVIYYNDDTSKPWFSIPVTSNGQVVGSIRVVKVAPSKVQSVGKDYLASFIYYSGGYSESNPSGTIEIYDLDDSNALVGKYTFSNGVPTSDLLYDDSRTHYCDKNQNGNVSFAECMTCMIGACFKDIECAAQCIAYQAINGTCLAAFNLACQIISIIY